MSEFTKTVDMSIVFCRAAQCNMLGNQPHNYNMFMLQRALSSGQRVSQVLGVLYPSAQNLQAAKSGPNQTSMEACNMALSPSKQCARGDPKQHEVMAGKKAALALCLHHVLTLIAASPTCYFSIFKEAFYFKPMEGCFPN